MGLYFRVMGLLMLIVFAFGFAGPWLVSQPSTISVLAGVGGLVVIVLPLTYKLVRGIIDDVTMLVRENNKPEENNDA